MGILAKVNKITNSLFGSVGRPTATVGVTSVGAFALRSKVEALENPMVAVGVGVATAVVTEGALFFFGDTTELELADAVKLISSSSEVTEKGLREAGLTDAEIEYIFEGEGVSPSAKEAAKLEVVVASEDKPEDKEAKS